ncbi:UDP-glucose 4-epimerase GalE [Mesomycoplasma neurolyticum]|uniref:UDP-glucose 4-epimerase n=1 Tax=Mesomycoplasma neurolyticum TaxID=2120 RepID=A0A449A558_9BACT|nr:UDP-glucose 4-epimerase GalE [Mesomycoplasma neurolyticum]VEU59430.1 UDP-glucose 4-epimerase [Mesomycoplasma neurolyticum]
MKKQTFFLIGGAGYIGSVFAWKLFDLKQNIIIADDLSSGNKEFLPPNILFYEIDYKNYLDLEKIFLNNKIDIVVNFSAYIKVGESVENSLSYYKNNLIGLINILELMNKYKINKLLFSSSAATYGQLNKKKIKETDIQNPINPYGFSKLFGEQIILDYAKNNKNFKYGILRYFNVAGADSQLRSGLYSKNNNYSLLIPVISNSLLENKQIYLFGNNYKTKDGTCIRDYIHVDDLAKIHFLVSQYLENNPSEIFNIGSSKGYSNLEIIQNFEKIVDHKINFQFKSKREGDPDILIASTNKIKNLLNFKNKYNLKDIISHEWNWRKKIKKYIK